MALQVILIFRPRDQQLSFSPHGSLYRSPRHGRIPSPHSGHPDNASSLNYMTSTLISVLIVCMSAPPKRSSTRSPMQHFWWVSSDNYFQNINMLWRRRIFVQDFVQPLPNEKCCASKTFGSASDFDIWGTRKKVMPLRKTPHLDWALKLIISVCKTTGTFLFVQWDHVFFAFTVHAWEAHSSPRPEDAKHFSYQKQNYQSWRSWNCKVYR